MKNQTQTYDCKNLTECAYLIASGIEPVESLSEIPGKTIWIFQRSAQLDKLVDEYACNRGIAGAISRFMQARRRLLNEAAERSL